MRKLDKYWTITRISLQNAIAYRASLISKCCFYTVFIYVFMRLWTTIYQEGSVEGYTRVQIVWYLITTELIAFGFSTNIYRTMNDEVKKGDIAYTLNRPVHYVFYQFANAWGQMLLNLVVFGVLGCVLGLLFVGPLPGFSFVRLPAIALCLLLGLGLNFFFHMLIGLSAFVLEENLAMYLIYQKVSFMLGVFLPVEFLPGWLQSVARNLPFSYVSWAPARLFVNFSWAHFADVVPKQALWLAVILGCTLLAYRGGMRKLQVNGG